MGIKTAIWDDSLFTLSWSEVTGAIGDSVTVLPIVVSVAVLTDLSLALMLVWFGVFQIVWGFYYGVPISVEPMKAVAALVIAGSITTGELLVAGLLIGVVLLTIGITGSLERVGQCIGSPVIRGIQFGVALVLLRTGIRLGSTNLQLAALAAVVATILIALGYWNMSGFVVFLLGGTLAVLSTGFPSPSLPPMDSVALVGPGSLTLPAVKAAVAQLAMTLGNAALATSVLLADYFDRDISADELSSSMGLMNIVGIPFGALPMCHGSGGVAGKYAFGARTVGANVILGLGYIILALLAVRIVAAYPVAMLGIILVLIALQLGRTSLEKADKYLLVISIGVLGLLVNLGVAFVAGIAAHLLFRRYDLW